jgi:hypothetical protein
MIELTKQQLDHFTSTYCRGDLADIVICKQLISESGGGVKTIGRYMSNIADVVMIKYEDLYFNDDILIHTPTYYSLTNHGLVNDSGVIKLNTTSWAQSEFGVYYVFYVVNTQESGYFEQFLNAIGINLTSIDYIGGNIKSIAFYATDGYPNLTEINLSDSLDTVYPGLGETNIGITPININFGNFNNIELSKGAFSGSPIKKIVLPNSRTGYNIPDNCFQGCTELMEVIIPDCVMEIGKNAFSGCTNLRYVSIGAWTQVIGECAFSGCDNIENIDVSVNNSLFLGEAGAILKKKLDDTYSIVFANDHWFNEGVTNCHTVTYNNTQVPVSYVITEIGEGACMDNTFQHRVDLTNHGISGQVYPYCMLYNFGKESFKNAKINNGITFPTNYSINFDVSSFEGSTVEFADFSTIAHVTIAEKAFFDCQNLTTIMFLSGSIVPAITFNNDGTYTEGIKNPIGKLAFANTPNLETITDGSSPQLDNNGMLINSRIAYNAILDNANKSIFLGCKNTDFATIYTDTAYRNICEGAFYGCTSLMSIGNTTVSNRIDFKYIGKNAFYNCSSIACPVSNPLYINGVTAIYENAFYNCTNIKALRFNCTGNASNGFFTTGKQELYSECFAKSGVEKILIDTSDGNKLDLKENDVFNGCTFVTVDIKNSNNNEYNNFSKVVKISDTNIENALIERPSASTLSDTLIKSGDGKDIITNLIGDGNRYNVVEIKSDAFSGVDIYSNNGTNVHIPASVITLGENTLSKSEIVGGVTRTLELDGHLISQSAALLVNDGQSIGLLYYLGGKYFKKIVEDCKYYPGSYHYYDITEGGGYIELYERNNGGSDIKILDISYTDNGIVANIDYSVNYDYANEDKDSHVTQLDGTINLILMYPGQYFEPAEENVYCDSDLTPGTVWLSGTVLSRTIPNDVSRASRSNYGYEYYTHANNCFTDINWNKNVVTHRNLGDMENAFKNNTVLAEIHAGDYDNDSKVDFNFLDGVVPRSMFEGCGVFQGLKPLYEGESHLRIPIKYNESAFKDCEYFNDSDNDEHSVLLRYGTHFESESFENSGLERINLVSAHYIDSKAFKDCNILSARADSPCGYYRTAEDGASIIDNDKKIVVGSCESNIEQYAFNGIGDYAFYGRDFADETTVYVTVNNNFTVGKNAFSKCPLSGYIENGTDTGVVTDKVYDEGAFKNCLNLTELTINNVVTIGDGLCEGCNSLTTVHLNDNTDIPNSAFSGCTSLNAFTTAANIEANAFNGCTSLSILKLNYTTNSVKTIDPTAFIDCPLNEIDSNEVKTQNGYFITEHCICKLNDDIHYELVVGILDSQNKYFPDSENVRVIGKHAFHGRGLVGDFVIPGCVTKIDDYAFAGNPGLTSVYIPSTVEYIGDHAFDGCTNIDYFTLPDSCIYFGEGALNGCRLSKGFNCNSMDNRYHNGANISSSPLISLSSPYLDACLDLTGTSVFTSISGFSNTGIKSIKLPENCTSVGADTFEYNSKLTELHFYSTSCSINQNAFYNCPYLSDVYIHNIDDITHRWGDCVGINGQFYGAGSYVSETTRHLHVNENIDQAHFATTNIYQILVNNNHFTVYYDL